MEFVGRMQMWLPFCFFYRYCGRMNMWLGDKTIECFKKKFRVHPKNNFDANVCLPIFVRICGIHSIGKGSIWSFLEMEILRKIGEMVKKKRFSLYWRVRAAETHLYRQNTEKVTPRLYSRSISHGNKGPIWSIPVAVVYSDECKASTMDFMDC